MLNNENEGEKIADNGVEKQVDKLIRGQRYAR